MKKRPVFTWLPPLFSAVGLYTVLLLLLFLNQGRLVFMPRQEVTITPGDAGLPFRSVELVAGDGVLLSAWFVPASTAKEEPGEHRPPVLLFCHGNAGNLSHIVDRIRVLHDIGVSVFAFDYRGYGGSAGIPSEDGVYRDAEAAWAYLVSPPASYGEENIVVHGHSLGAAVAARLAAVHDPAALILESPFISAPRLAADRLPLFPVRALLRDRFDTAESLQAIHCPVLVVHSHEDRITPYSHGARLYAEVNSPKRMLTIEGDHNSGYRTSEAVYREGLGRFLADVVTQRAGSSPILQPP